MADPVTIGAAVGWAMKAAEWVVSPIISKLVSKGFSYLSFDASEKLKQLEIKVVQLELMLGLEAVKISPHRNRLEPLLKSLKSAFYEAEDILDDVEYHRLERQIVSHPGDKLEADGMPPRKRNRVKKLQSVLPKCSYLKTQDSGNMSDDSPPDISRRELKNCLEKIESIVNEALGILSLLNLPSHADANKRQTSADNSRGLVTAAAPSSSRKTTAAPPPVVIGRDEDRERIITMLHETEDDGQPNTNSGLCYSVIGIHGIPGSGKSTLAQYVCAREKNYKQEKKDGHFDLVMWIHVSQNFSVDTIFREMLEEATGKPSPEFRSLNTLEQMLEEALSGKRFLLVLDDVWYNKDVSHQELQQIISPLKVGKAGSKILVTSRTSDALLALGAVRCIPIRDLDEHAFLELFMHYALQGARLDGHDRSIFETIGVDIAKRLKRSPLVAGTVGGQPRIRPNVDFWRRVRDRDVLTDTMGALWWSYQHLDEQARRCFAYCSIFPRRHLLKRDELVNFWVAEGFIKTTEIGEEMEGIAQDYFDELVSTSFLQLGGKNYRDRDYYTMHDLLHDLAEKVAGSDCFRIENGWTGEVPRDVRHLFVETCNRALLAEKILKLENLRTLIISSGTTEEEIEDEDFGSMFTGLRKLRILSVQVRRQSRQFSVPASIGQLKHIRYLAIKTNFYTKLILPSTFTKLYHMQVLDFGSCRELVFYPGQDIMSNLINLRHILTLRDLNLPNIIRLTSLQTLPDFRVRKEPGYELRQLKNLNKLRGWLGIKWLENVGSKEEALEANLAGKERITDLTLGWSRDDRLRSYSADLEAEILEGLSPPMGLENFIFCSRSLRAILYLRHILTSGRRLNLRNIIRLTSLQTLPDFEVRKEPGYELRQLRDLNKLRGRLGIVGLENVGSKEEALEANLAGKERITRLDLMWDRNSCIAADLEAEILEGLCPPMGLQGRLEIRGLENVGSKEEALEANLAGKECLTGLDLMWGQNSCSADLEAEILEGLCPPMGLQTLVIQNYEGSRYPDWMVGNKNGPKHLQQTTEIGEEMEGIAQYYFDELVSTSFLQRAGKDSQDREYYTIHDLLHDLAEKVAGSDCFRIENGCTEVPPGVRHLFVETYNRSMVTEKISKLENLRTLIIHSGTTEAKIEDKDFGSMFTSRSKLRILSVPLKRDSRQFSLPASIGHLKHIRYLAIRNISKLILRSTFTKLYHMQVLDFGPLLKPVSYPGQYISVIPPTIMNSIIRRSIMTCIIPPNIYRLTSLQTLPAFRVRKEPGYKLRQLRDLNKLRGSLEISDLGNVGSKEEALEANLAGKERLTDLTLSWYSDAGLRGCNVDLEAEILEGLCPPMGLEKLGIWGYEGSRYPDWMVGNKNGPKHLQRLVLRRCSPLGANFGTNRNEFFVHLRSLKLWHCRWDALPDNMEHLTSLKELIIDSCMNIRSLATLPQSLKYLNIDRCNDVFTRSCKTIGDPNWQKIEHVPNKDIK